MYLQSMFDVHLTKNCLNTTGLIYEKSQTNIPLYQHHIHINSSVTLSINTLIVNRKRSVKKGRKNGSQCDDLSLFHY